MIPSIEISILKENFMQDQDNEEIMLEFSTPFTEERKENDTFLQSWTWCRETYSWEQKSLYRIRYGWWYSDEERDESKEDIIDDISKSKSEYPYQLFDDYRWKSFQKRAKTTRD